MFDFELEKPARRHKCEVCEERFICHLCTIRKTHPVHKEQSDMLPTTMMFICRRCCRVQRNRFQRRRDGARAGYFTDMLTGKSDLPFMKTVDLYMGLKR